MVRPYDGRQGGVKDRPIPAGALRPQENGRQPDWPEYQLERALASKEIAPA